MRQRHKFQVANRVFTPLFTPPPGALPRTESLRSHPWSAVASCKPAQPVRTPRTAPSEPPQERETALRNRGSPFETFSRAVGHEGRVEVFHLRVSKSLKRDALTSRRTQGPL